MDYSPILISIKTAALTIVLVFFCRAFGSQAGGRAAKRNSENVAGRSFYSASGAAVYGGWFFPFIYFWHPQAYRKVFH